MENKILWSEDRDTATAKTKKLIKERKRERFKAGDCLVKETTLCKLFKKKATCQNSLSLSSNSTSKNLFQGNYQMCRQ